MKRSRFPQWVTWAVLLFLYLPIIVLVINSFNASRFSGAWSGFTLKWYSQLMEESEIWSALSNSLIVALTATCASTVLGSLAAFALFRYRTKLQVAHYGLIYLPLIVPDILMGISLLLLFVSIAMPLGLSTIFFAHTTFRLSYITMVMLARLQSFDFAIVEAAQDLGANWFTTLFRVVLPSIAPAIIAGALLAFTISFDDFVITYFVAGPGSTTLPLYVYGMIKFGSPPLISALSTLILIVTTAIILLTQWLSKEELF